jgi:Sel1 repeat
MPGVFMSQNNEITSKMLANNNVRATPKLNYNNVKFQILKDILSSFKQGNFNQINTFMNMVTPHLSEDQSDVATAINACVNDFIKLCESKQDESNFQFVRAVFYLRGIGGCVNTELAIKLLKKAVEKNNSYAMCLLGKLLIDGKITDKHIDKGITYLDKAAELGNANAMINRAYLYRIGMGSAIDLEKAISFLDKAIQLNHSGALAMRAIMLGAPEHLKVAKQYLEQGIALDNSPQCQTLLAKMYISGQLGPYDRQAAIQLLDQSIKLNYSIAMILRARLYQQGYDDIQDDKLASRLFRRAKASNWLNKFKHPYYQYHLAMLSNDINKVVELIKINYDIKHEFFDYECKVKLYSIEQILLVNRVLAKLIENNVSPSLLNKAYVSLVMVFEGKNKLPQVSDFENTFKFDCINKIHWSEVDKNHIIPLANILSDLWMDNEIEHGEFSIKKLCQLIFRIGSFNEFDMRQFPTRLAALMLIKNACGENYEVTLDNNINLQHLLILAAMVKTNKIVDFELLRDKLGFSIIKLKSNATNKRKRNSSDETCAENKRLKTAHHHDLTKTSSLEIKRATSLITQSVRTHGIFSKLPPVPRLKIAAATGDIPVIHGNATF